MLLGIFFKGVSIVVIVGVFSNIEKNYIRNNYVVNCIDLDRHNFNKVEGWICLLSLKETYDYVFITTHGDILNELSMIYPEK